jgi:uncharacterized peroxidase-related enzyme
MRLATDQPLPLKRQRAVQTISRLTGAELDDVGQSCMRWPDLWGRPLLALAQEVLRGTSSWTVGERELLAAVVSQANACSFCVGTHSAIADRALAVPAFAGWEDGRAGPAVTAAARFVVKLTQSPEDLGTADVAATRAAGVTDAALAEAIYIAFLFNAINRVADALEFTHHSERARIQGANLLRRMGYRPPGFLLGGSSRVPRPRRGS